MVRIKFYQSPTTTMLLKYTETSVRRFWTQLSLKCGSPFHSTEFCAIIERYWPGKHEPMHVLVSDRGGCRAAVPAFLFGSCPRLDYYRSNVSPRLDDRVIGCHALVGWYGGPIGQDDTAVASALEAHLECCRYHRALSLLFGIDGRDVRTLAITRAAGYHVARFHTVMVRNISPEHRSYIRRERRKIMRLAEEAGTRLELRRPSEALQYASLLRSAVVRDGLAEDVLSTDYLQAVMRANLPGLEVLLAMTPDGTAAALNLNFIWGSHYYMWLGGNDRSLAKPYYPSDFLYQHAIRRTELLGLSEIQAGRSPYGIKQSYGFRPVPIMAALHKGGSDLQADAIAWLNAQEARHLSLYPEVSR